MADQLLIGASNEVKRAIFEGVASGIAAPSVDMAKGEEFDLSLAVRVCPEMVDYLKERGFRGLFDG